jgi:hypothetical protein
MYALRALPYEWGDDATRWRADDDNHFRLALGLGLSSIAAVALLWFVAVVRRRVGEREDQFFSTAFFGSALVYICIWLVGTTCLAAPAIIDQGALDLGAIRLAESIAVGLMLVVGPRIQAVFVASASTIFLRTAVLPNWVAYVGYAAALILFVVPLVSSPFGLAMPIFVLLTSATILLLRQRLSTSDDDAASGALGPAPDSDDRGV